ncbi:MAG TPA: cupin domain-containing protein [Devosiaceae bacterium]
MSSVTGVEPFAVLAGSDRFASPVNFLNGRFDCKVSSKDTGGALCVFDTYRFKQGGPPVHLHLDQDEWFLVLDGEFRFQVGEQMHHLRAGDSIFGPRGVPHAFRNLTDSAQLMVTFLPAGTMEGFFASEMVDPLSQEFRDLSRRHGMIVVGPPLAP